MLSSFHRVGFEVNRCTNVLEERDSGAAVVSFPWQLMYALKVKRLAAKGKKNTKSVNRDTFCTNGIIV